MKKISATHKLNMIKNKLEKRETLTPTDQIELKEQLNTKIKAINTLLDKSN